MRGKKEAVRRVCLRVCVCVCATNVLSFRQASVLSPMGCTADVLCKRLLTTAPFKCARHTRFRILIRLNCTARACVQFRDVQLECETKRKSWTLFTLSSPGSCCLAGYFRVEKQEQCLRVCRTARWPCLIPAMAALVDSDTKTRQTGTFLFTPKTLEHTLSCCAVQACFEHSS